MPGLRRRAVGVGQEPQTPLETESNSQSFGGAFDTFPCKAPVTIAGIVALLAFVSYAIAVSFVFSSAEQKVLLSGNISSDSESSISQGALPFENYIPESHAEKALVCMPTVTRRDGSVEYVSNAVKSWRLATNGSSDLHRLLVFNMDVSKAQFPAPKTPPWMNVVFSRAAGWDGSSLPSWLQVLQRENGESFEPRKLTLGDSEERVRWRSKEALDYAQVLRRCADLAHGRYIIIVQDDVLFTERMTEVVSWCETHMVETVSFNEATGRRVVDRICSASLFDLATPADIDGHLLASSNMVARVWEVARARSLARYIESNFDEAPVDWLADRICRSQRRKTIVVEPNPVRHRGAVSSFAENVRESTLT